MSLSPRETTVIADLLADLAEQRVALVERVGDVLAGAVLATNGLVDRLELPEQVVQLVDRFGHGRVRVVAHGRDGLRWHC